jgi:hypothetical protein
LRVRVWKPIIPWLLLITAAILPSRGFSIGQPKYVETTPAFNSFRLVHEKTAATLYADPNDYAGVVRAVHDLQADILRVSGCNALISEDGKSLSGDVVLIGTIGKSRIIER